jgi:hypothetical protein
MPKKPKPLRALYTPDLFTGERPEKIKRPYHRKPKPEPGKYFTPALEFSADAKKSSASPALSPAQVAARILGSLGGQSKSPAKVAAARRNGRRPKKFTK